MRREYSRYLLTKTPRFQPYDRHLSDLVVSVLPMHGRVLEVASGTGYPFSQELHRKGYQVYGVDIAEALIRESVRLDPGIVVCVGDAERLPFAAHSFDAAFCFHSTFFFPDLSSALDEMIRVTKSGGTMLFDIQNAGHPSIARAYALRRSAATGSRRWLRYGKNIAKIVLRRGFPDWSSVVREVPTPWQSVSAELRSHGIKEILRLGRSSNDSLEPIEDDSSVDTFARLVYVAKI